MEWYLYRNNTQYGPYPSKQLIEMQKSGQLQQTDLFCRPGGNWISLQEAGDQWNAEQGSAFPQQPFTSGSPQDVTQQFPVQSAASPKKYKPPKRKAKRRLGCLTIFVIVIGITAGGIYLFVNRNSNNITTGSRQSITTQTVSSSGGTIEFALKEGGNGTAKLTVPKGAYGKDTKFKISERTVKEHKFGENFNPITPLITIDNNHEFADAPMQITFPVKLAKGEFAMAFYYDRKTGELEGLPLVKETSSSVTVAAQHFSDIVLTKTRISAFANIDIDTGFEPGYDDWQFTNYGSYIAPGGHCAGQSITEMWYFTEKYKGSGERRLYGRYDNNDYGSGTIDLWQDDSWGYRYSSVIQSKIDWDSKGIKASQLMSKLGDDYTYNAFAYSMILTKNPQFVAIYRYGTDGKVAGGHAIVAYKIKNNKIYVADPNYPGRANRNIDFNMGNNKFTPYSSGANAADIAAGKGYKYSKINYYGVTSMINWDTIKQEYNNMLDEKAGEDKFPRYSMEVLKKVDPDTGEETWEQCPDMLQLKLEDTAEVSEKYAGKLVFRIKPDYSNMCCSLYSGTELKKNPEVPGSKGYLYYIVKLENGANDLGFYMQIYSNSKYYYIDFKRVKVIYETVDLTGTWKGNMQITEAGNIVDYISGWLAKFYAAIMQSSDKPVDENQAREDIKNYLKEQIYYKKVPMTLELTKTDPDDDIHYTVTVRYKSDDGEDMVYDTKLTYKNGDIEFHIYDSQSASRMNFTCYLQGDGIFQGKFVVHAWGGLVRNAFSGDWKAEKEDNP